MPYIEIMKGNDPMTYDELVTMIEMCDKLMDYIESLSEEKFELLVDTYNTTYEMREHLRQQEVEFQREKLEQLFAIS